MDKFLEMRNLPRLNQEEIEIINRTITSTEIDTVIKNLPTQLQKDREDEKAEGYVPDEGTRKNPRKTTK